MPNVLPVELSPFPSIPGFFILENKNDLYIPYSLMMAFETVVLALTLIKAKGQRGISKLHKTLYEDSLLYYSFLFSVSVANTAMLIAGPVVLRPVLASIHRVLHSVSSGRIILNIHEASCKSRAEFHSSNFLSGDSVVITLNLEGLGEESKLFTR